MNTQEYSFWKLISEYHIEIPGIQRDYAQGRKSERKIATDLIRDLFDALDSTETKKVNLHFVYGKIDDNKHLTPLDGQQRLTTLFLLHWFLSIGILGDKKNVLSKFTYETRPSSEDFCLKLIKEGIEKYDENENVSEQIKNSKWFFPSWENDPTVSAMLNMLDIIQSKFKQPNEKWFKKLIGEDSPIQFHFLPLEKFKLDDRIYVRMNSRGKPLTEFENFKANFSSLFNIDDRSKLDNEWLDIFWRLEKDNETINTKEVDRKYLNFIKNATLNFYVETRDIDTDPQKLDVFEKYKDVYRPNTEYLNQLSKIFDSLQSYNDDKDYFKSFLEDTPKKPDYWERLRFYAVMQFFIKKGNLNQLNTELYKKWIRVCVNLINNTRIESPELFCKAIKSIKQLSNNIDNLYEYLTKPETKIESFLKDQCEEEVLKADLLHSCKEKWEIPIYEIENHDYFNGQIGFILKWVKQDNVHNIEKFIDYSQKLSELFGDKFKDKKKCLFQRALLTFGEYLVDINNCKTFCTFNLSLRDKVDNWRKVFSDDIKNNYLKQLLDKISIDSIENDLEQIVNAYPDDFNDWKSLFIKNEGIIEHCDKYRIAHRDNKIALSRSDANSWKRHAELYTYTLFKSKLEWRAELFAPFTITRYWDTADGEPCAVIDNWCYKQYNFEFDIRHNHNGDFSIAFFAKGEKQIPDEIKNVLSDYESVENRLYLNIQQVEKFDMIVSKILEKTKLLKSLNDNYIQENQIVMLKE